MSIKTDINTVILHPFLTHPTLPDKLFKSSIRKCKKNVQGNEIPSREVLVMVGVTSVKAHVGMRGVRLRPLPTVSPSLGDHAASSRGWRVAQGLLRGQTGLVVCQHTAAQRMVTGAALPRVGMGTALGDLGKG